MVDHERLHYVDYAKAIGVWLVCFGHFLPAGSNLRIFLYSFHVPLFFVLAGMCGKDSPMHSCTDLLKKVKKLATRILLPYVVWYWISSIPAYFIMGTGIDEILRCVFFVDGKTIWNTALWFLPCYFLVMVGFYFARLIMRDNKALMIGSALLMFAVAYIFDAMKIKECFLGINKCCLLYTFVVAGSTIGGVRISSSEKKRYLFGMSTVVFAVVGLISVCYHAGDNISIMNLDYNNITVFTVLGIIMSISFSILCVVLPRSVQVERIADISLFIMASHLFARLLLQVVGIQEGPLFWVTGLLLLPLFYWYLCSIILKIEQKRGCRVTVKCIGLV